MLKGKGSRGCLLDFEWAIKNYNCQDWERIDFLALIHVYHSHLFFSLSTLFITSKATWKRNKFTEVAYGKCDLAIGEIITPCFARWCIWPDYIWKTIMPFENHLLVYFCNSFEIPGFIFQSIVFSFSFMLYVFLLLLALQKWILKQIPLYKINIYCID